MGDIGDMMTTEAVTETGTENLTVTTVPNFVYPDWWWDFWETILKARAEQQDFRDKWLDFSSIWASVLCCVSLITNGLCILTFATKKSKKEQTVNTFLIALAIADSFSLVNAWNKVAMYWTGTDVINESNAGCKLVPYIGNIARDCSYYITLGFTIDRFISVTVPLKRALWINKARVRAYLVALVVTFAAAEVYLPYHAEYFNNIDGKPTCLFPNEDRLKRCLTYVQYVAGFILPATLVFALNILIVRQLVKRATKRQEMTGQDGQDPNRRLTILLMFISTWSFLVSTPRMIAYMIHIWYHPGLMSDPKLHQRLYETILIGDSVRLLNFSCNFFFYCLSGSQFRDDLIRALHRVFCCHCEYFKNKHELHLSFADYHRMHRKLTNYGYVRSL